MVKGIKIKQITLEDLSSVFKTGCSSDEPNPFYEDWTENCLAESLLHDSALSFAAKRKKDLAGFIIGKKTGPAGASIVRLYISPAWKNRGIEKKLLDCFTQTAMEHGLKEINTDIEPDCDLSDLLSTEGFSEEKKIVRLKRIIQKQEK